MLKTAANFELAILRDHVTREHTKVLQQHTRTADRSRDLRSSAPSNSHLRGTDVLKSSE